LGTRTGRSALKSKKVVVKKATEVGMGMGVEKKRQKMGGGGLGGGLPKGPL